MTAQNREKFSVAPNPFVSAASHFARRSVKFVSHALRVSRSAC